MSATPAEISETLLLTILHSVCAHHDAHRNRFILFFLDWYVRHIVDSGNVFRAVGKPI